MISTNTPVLPSDPSKPTLYALLVGINAYENFPLRGPVSDVAALERYLGGLFDFNRNVEVLTDEHATKAALARAFSEHLGQAGPGDTILFYFSGHGTQELADPSLWPGEADGLLEAIACHNGGGASSHDFLLTDKELRYLLHRVSGSGAHTLALFDCCHSGENTRSLLELTGQDVRERSISVNFPARPWEAFLFSGEISESQARSQPLESWLPEADYVQMAACESDEKALEIGVEGVFTKNLLNVLRASEGAVSYAALHDRVRQYMRFAYDQRPKLLAPQRDAEALLKTGFLGRIPRSDAATSVEVTYNPSRGWLLNAGALHGLKPQQVVPLLDAAGAALGNVAVASVGIDYALLAPDPVLPPPAPGEQPVYRALLENLMKTPLRVFLSSRNGSPADQAQLLSSLVEKAGGCYLPEDDEIKADYRLTVRNGWYFLTRPGDEFRPLAKPVPVSDPEAIPTLVKYIRHLAHYAYLNTLQNPEAAGTTGIDIEVVPEGGPPLPLPEGDDPTLAVPLLARGEVPDRGRVWGNNVAVRLTNTTGQAVYATVLYLSNTFRASTAFLETNTLLEPGQTVQLGLKPGNTPGAVRGTTVALSYSSSSVPHDYNWPEVTERFRVILTPKNDHSPDASGVLSAPTLAFFSLNPLPDPPTRAKRDKPGLTRDDMLSDPAPLARPLPVWWTQSVALRWENPTFNRLEAEEVNAMLEVAGHPASDALADCALGLYFDLSREAPLDARYVVKPELLAYWQEAQTRGWLGDLTFALTSRVSQGIRNRKFFDDEKRFPTRLRVLAQGDSWFQYPFLIRDIIDYLQLNFLVYSESSAGKTLETMQEDEAIADTIQTLKDRQARFFLVSGGLNDVMKDFGETFLRATPDPRQTGARRYLNDAFFQTLDTIQAQYERLFTAVRRELPQVHIVTHGYDYVLPVNQVSQKETWLAPQLAEGGISDPAEQQALLNFTVDEFNQRLAQASARFAGEGLSYLDVRKAINPAYWHDEIHPNDKGFLSLALRFTSRMRKVAADFSP